VAEHSDGDRAGCNFFPLASDVKAYTGLSQRASLLAWDGSTGCTLAHSLSFLLVVEEHATALLPLTRRLDLTQRCRCRESKDIWPLDHRKARSCHVSGASSAALTLHQAGEKIFATVFLG
jgi:hypothetical protein